MCRVGGRSVPLSHVLEQPCKRPYCFHLIGEESKAQRGEVVCSRSHSQRRLRPVCSARSLWDSQAPLCVKAPFVALGTQLLQVSGAACQGSVSRGYRPLERRAEMPSLLLVLTAGLCLPGSWGLPLRAGKDWLLAKSRSIIWLLLIDFQMYCRTVVIPLDFTLT